LLARKRPDGLLSSGSGAAAPGNTLSGVGIDISPLELGSSEAGVGCEDSAEVFFSNSLSSSNCLCSGKVRAVI
jgi:hypothetical protein